MNCRESQVNYSVFATLTSGSFPLMEVSDGCRESCDLAGLNRVVRLTTRKALPLGLVTKVGRAFGASYLSENKITRVLFTPSLIQVRNRARMTQLAQCRSVRLLLLSCIF